MNEEETIPQILGELAACGQDGKVLYHKAGMKSDGSAYEITGVTVGTLTARLVGAYSRLLEKVVRVEQLAHCDLSNVKVKYQQNFDDKFSEMEWICRQILKG